MEQEASEAQPHSRDRLAQAMEVLANGVRLELLQRLGTPAFMPELVKEFGMTRQALKKHLEVLEAVDLVVAQPARRGALPATRYVANPAGLFAFKEAVLGLAVTADPGSLPPTPTRSSALRGEPVRREAPGLLLVHGDTQGRWFPLGAQPSWILGRGPRADVALPYDPFASARHALLHRRSEGWTLTDLHSTNGTRVNFHVLPAGETVDVEPGDLLTIGKSHLLLRDGI